MYEFTMGGWWFRWSALDKPSRRLAGASMALAMAAAMPVGVAVGRYSYEIGRCVGSGDWSICTSADSSISPLLALLAVAFAVASGVLWTIFSKRQDEMFNRVQNWALGMAGAWTGAAIMVWAMLEIGGLVPVVSLGSGTLLFLVLACVFWWIAVRRWAY